MVVEQSQPGLSLEVPVQGPGVGAHVGLSVGGVGLGVGIDTLVGACVGEGVGLGVGHEAACTPTHALMTKAAMTCSIIMEPAVASF